MHKEDILNEIKNIQCRYCLPALEINFTDKDYACKQYEKLIIHIANQQEEKDKEIERLNNNWNELEKWVNKNKEEDSEICYLHYEIWKKVINKIKELEGVDKK